MGSGRSIRHQTHVVDTGAVGADSAPADPLVDSGDATTPEAPRPGYGAVEHLTPESTAIRSLAFAPSETHGGLGLLDVAWQSSDSTYRFHVEASTWQRIRDAAEVGASVGRVINEIRRANEGHIVRDEDSLLNQEAPAAPQTHCPGCGQFIGETEHDCPVGGDRPQSQYSLPDNCWADVINLATALTYARQSDRPLFVSMRGGVSAEGGQHEVFGVVGLYNPAEEPDLDVAAAGLRCSCGQTNCVHAQTLAASVNEQLSREAHLRAQAAGRELLRRMASSADPLPGLPLAQGRCQTCGQFVGAAAHRCPVTDGPIQYHDTLRGVVATPAMSRLRENCDFGSGAVMIPIAADLSFPEETRSHTVTGFAHLYSPRQTPQWSDATNGLSCTCGQAHCVHMLGATAIANERFRVASGVPGRTGALTWSGQTRCPRCGQFMGEAAHACPVHDASLRRYVNDYGQIRIPNVTALRDGCDFGTGDIRIPLQGHFQLPDEPRRTIQGDVVVPSARGDFNPAVAGRQLRCDCGQPLCRHAQLAAAEVVDRLRAPRISQPDRRATTAVLERLSAEREASVVAHSRTQEWADSEAPSYSDNPRAFQAAYRDALDRRARGEAAVPYLLENATDGLGARDGGRAFGVELEFDLGDVPSRDNAIRSIAADLHAAGLSRHSTMGGYHASRTAGYSDARNAWRLEHDSTVAGEVVSPILYDTPQTWQDLQTVCDIIRRHGGQATVRTGGHIHVATGDYDHTVANHNRLLHMTHNYSDTLFRLAANPGRGGRHRGTSWCRPNDNPSRGYSSVSAASYNNQGHGYALNLESINGRDNDHAEFRMWDGSLDPGVIQTQIKVSLGIAEAAFREAHSTDLPNGGRVDSVGTHAARYGRRRLRGAEWSESTRSFRSLIDTIFRRDVDKAQATSLFAVNRWQRRRR